MVNAADKPRRYTKKKSALTGAALSNARLFFFGPDAPALFPVNERCNVAAPLPM